MVLKSLGLSCSNADCEEGLHCFRVSQKLKSRYPKGACQSCGEKLIDWPRVIVNDLSDVEHKIASLKKEWIRHYFWEEKLGQRALNYAIRKGKIKLEEAIYKRLNQSVRPAAPAFDGRQTPFPKDGKALDNPIFYAQHAVACCCRKCIEYWHGIEQGRELNARELRYLTSFCMKYLTEKVNGLTDDGKHVPPIRRVSPRRNS